MFYNQILVIILGLIGTVMIFIYSPKVNSQTFFYNQSEVSENQARDKKKNIMSRIGLILVMISFILQIGLVLTEKYINDRLNSTKRAQEQTIEGNK